MNGWNDLSTISWERKKESEHAHRLGLGGVGFGERTRDEASIATRSIVFSI
jgi:hypothetical protein